MLPQLLLLLALALPPAAQPTRLICADAGWMPGADHALSDPASTQITSPGSQAAWQRRSGMSRILKAVRCASTYDDNFVRLMHLDFHYVSAMLVYAFSSRCKKISRPNTQTTKQKQCTSRREGSFFMPLAGKGGGG